VVEDVTDRGAQAYFESKRDIVPIADCAWDKKRDSFGRQGRQLFVLRAARINRHHQDGVVQNPLAVLIVGQRMSSLTKQTVSFLSFVLWESLSEHGSATFRLLF
jgi:hypothetical protein